MILAPSWTYRGDFHNLTHSIVNSKLQDLNFHKPQQNTTAKPLVQHQTHGYEQWTYEKESLNQEKLANFTY